MVLLVKSIGQVLAPALRPRVSLVLDFCLEHLSERLTVAALARTAHVQPRILAYHFKQFRLPTPARTLVWRHVLRAAWLLDVPGTTVERAAAFARVFVPGRPSPRRPTLRAGPRQVAGRRVPTKRCPRSP
jgi:hypothetical protein